MKRIYLDNAATTKPDPLVIRSMVEVQREFWGNASSIYSEGQKAKQMLEDCRKTFAHFIGCEAEEIIFTSGGTEADNLAIKGIIDAFYGNNQGTRNNNQTNHNSQITNTQKLTADSYKLKVVPHIITSAFEHHAVLYTVQELEKKGLIEATYIKPNSEGLVEVKDVEAAIKENTVLVSIMYVNNEVGTVQPIREIAQAISRENSKRQDAITNQYPNLKLQNAKTNDSKKLESYKLQANKIYFHTDAVQGAEYFELSPKYLDVDLMSIAAHKFHGPKGVGALYVRKGTPLVHQQIGGGQERKKRAGTENVAGIRGMVTAYEIIFRQRADEGIEDPDKMDLSELKRDKTTSRVQQLRDKLIDGIMEKIPDAKLNGSRVKRSPANANISFINAEGESIILMLDMAGISVSSGSACTSGSLEPSHVLLSMGMPHEQAHGSVRFSLSKETTEGEIDKVLEVLPPIIERLRKMSPYS